MSSPPGSVTRVPRRELPLRYSVASQRFTREPELSTTDLRRMRRLVKARPFSGESPLVRYAIWVKLPHTLFALLRPARRSRGIVSARRHLAAGGARGPGISPPLAGSPWPSTGLSIGSLMQRNPRTQTELPRDTGAYPGLGFGRDCGPVVRRRRRSQPALSLPEPLRAWLDHVVQPEQAIHLVAAPLAGDESGDRPVADTWRSPANGAGPGGPSSRSVLRSPPGSRDSTSSDALPDQAFDKGEGLRSAVVRLGEKRSILVAKLLHGVTIPAWCCSDWERGSAPGSMPESV